ncbi:MAG: hypothetical protein SO267_13750 [Lachnospiraceae bacterium]|nr:hypothetical protein [Lachnospiraceae bacterium]
MKNNSDLFYTCSLIEFIGRQQKLKRSEVVQRLGIKIITRIYQYADVFHCEPIEKTADDFITRCNIPMGSFDNVADCRYSVPDYWTIGEVYERLIEDVSREDMEHIMERLMDVYTSWIDDAISNYNTDFFYQSREYIHECYKEGKVCE